MHQHTNLLNLWFHFTVDGLDEANKPSQATVALNIIFLLYSRGSLEMLTIEHEHVVLFIMLTMIILP
jgi:hypothetical protein